MKTLSIYEPAMCCSTGLCGVSYDPELLRISAAIINLKKHGIVVERYNLSSSPAKFMVNSEVNELIDDKGIKELPISEVDNKVVMTKRYPTNQEIAAFLGISLDYIEEKAEAEKDQTKACCSKKAGTVNE